jgi:hypothetical protein
MKAQPRDRLLAVRRQAEENRHRILVLIKGLGLGGAERLIVDSLPYLDRDRFEYELGYLLP